MRDLNLKPVYVGETSRSLKERAKEHWTGYLRKSEDNHMRKHQELHHDGHHPPKFIMRMVTQTRSALERQVEEAIRIRRRGEQELY